MKKDYLREFSFVKFYLDDGIEPKEDSDIIPLLGTSRAGDRWAEILGLRHLVLIFGELASNINRIKWDAGMQISRRPSQLQRHPRANRNTLVEI